MTAVLGISAFYHDSAAALVVDGDIVAAAQEERFTRKKHDDRFPVLAIEYCLAEGGLTGDKLDFVGFYDKPLQKFDRLLETYLAHAPRGIGQFMAAMPLWLRKKLHIPRQISRGLKKTYHKRYIFSEHHESHAASAFFPSPFEEAAILTLDGVGEWATASCGTGRGNRLSLSHELHFPHSLGLLYSAFTYYCGFKVNSGEYKLMGLAPYGEPKYVDLILEKLIDLKEDGSFRMNMSYFDYCHGTTMISRKFEALFGGQPRKPNTLLTQREMDIAASIQKVTEEIILRSVRRLHGLTGMRNLCLAGGVALNCVANGRIMREGPFENIWVQPAAGDAGGALGVAMLIWHQLLDHPRRPSPGDSQHGTLLGPAYSDEQIKAFLDSVDATYTYVGDDDVLCEQMADAIATGSVVGWFQGRMEFGPRALGSRSILADSRDAKMQKIINMKVKFREGFRPFAPSVLRSHVHEYFDVPPETDSPYMLLVTPVKAERRCGIAPEQAGLTGIDKLHIRRSEIPAVTHVDLSARIQTVDPDRHGLYCRLLEAFHRKTGCPVVVNTSFNLGWEPIVQSPKDAYRTFMSSEIDTLCMGHYVLEKSRQQATVPRIETGGSDPVLGGLWCSPCCRAELGTEDGRATCSQCGRAFDVDNGITLLYHPHDEAGSPEDVTEKIKAFYEETPFPNYDDHDSVRSLVEKSQRSGYVKMLDEAIAHNSTVLEVGCGTGQLTNFLGVSCRRVIGTDICLNSLRLGQKFSGQHDLDRVRFLQMNLFRPCFRPEQFDTILCLGVLHHTSDPFGGFKALAGLLRPGGHIIIGLYNRYGRLMTNLRRAAFRLTAGRGKWLDPVLRTKLISEGQRQAWFSDQYYNPHESRHTIGEVQGWFRQCGLEFVRSLPSVRPEDDIEPGGPGLFLPAQAGNSLHRAVAQFKQIFTGAREGGFFVMVGRKPLSEPAGSGPNAEQ